MTYNPEVLKERVYAKNGMLYRCDGNYNISATDVRWIKFDLSKVRLQLVYEKGAKVSDLVKKYNADYGFNFPFFWDGVTIANCKIGNNVISEAYDNMVNWHSVGYRNNKVEIGMLDFNEDYDFLVQTTPCLLSNGNQVWDYYRIQDQTAEDIGMDANGNYVRAQRTFVGLDNDGNLIVAVGDGRTKWDRGLTLEEMALFMLDKGAVVAQNGDGGSSTVLANKDGVMSQNAGTIEENVNHAILVYILPEPEPIPTNPDQWKIDMGINAAKELNSQGILQDPEAWSDKMLDAPQNWMVFELLRRILNKE